MSSESSSSSVSLRRPDDLVLGLSDDRLNMSKSMIASAFISLLTNEHQSILLGKAGQIICFTLKSTFF